MVVLGRPLRDAAAASGTARTFGAVLEVEVLLGFLEALGGVRRADGSDVIGFLREEVLELPVLVLVHVGVVVDGLLLLLLGLLLGGLVEADGGGDFIDDLVAGLVSLGLVELLLSFLGFGLLLLVVVALRLGG